MKLISKFLKLNFGLILLAFGAYLSISANIGLSPWEAFHMGISNITGMSFGDASVLISVLILVIDFFLKEKIGFGTIINTLLIGKFADIFIWLDPVPKMDNFYLGVVVLLIAQVANAVGIYYYMSVALGSGPRDSLMMSLKRRVPKLPIGVTRAIIDCIALAGGWLMGASIGIGTIISMVGISFILNITFKLFKFNSREVEHEDVFESIARFKKERAAKVHTN